MHAAPRVLPRAPLIAVAMLLVCASWIAWKVAPTPYPEVEVDLSAAGLGGTNRRRGPRDEVLRLSVAAMQSPRSTYVDYSRLLTRVGQLLDVETELIQRRTYREVNDLLAAGQLDGALLCTGGYLELARHAPSAVEVLAVPVVGGKTTYRSLIIVPAGSTTASVSELAGKRFAFTDELSLSGRMYIAYRLRRDGHDPARFFGSAIFTHSHDRSIEAVASGLVDGAAVDSLVFEYWKRQEPARAAAVRVIHESPEFGTMPFVVSTRLPAGTRARLHDILLSLHEDPAALAALQAIHIERFVAPRAGLFDSAAVMLEGTP